ncbi:TPA: type II toxin-antitoxin system RelE/ParE family toxin [Yersinia enterocolitica]|nr:type II toxin-antitoxin system RelE/ParE family toxin [Yersinia enterocolitica]EKN3315029.1 type II toxin-antitoxin system RelE/ParE family toxin [Yersinia enterocolitica]EKN3320190.1 type II toxin-antitoxin system RelE/ParE family toxin [Yersinia enterocolitica]EKN3324108.1 type II toxin-antitoxin system RelE/ParE family toxin [Yersinia enterocolitica]EKN3330929.1 type II toxin-antitoxin system RelE/ParE family toxin [Yersinia enterocolitica]EKN3334690.1 type II toxin-antitoxin system RelE
MYKLSELADEDIYNIASYTIRHFGVTQAKLYHENLAKVFELLAKNLELGAECNWICSDMRRFQYKKHGIYYITLSNDILISRVLHQSIDIDAQDFPEYE